MERTFVAIKPDAFARGLVGRIIARYEEKGLKIVALECRKIDSAFAAKHYEEHVGRSYYPELEAFICSGPLVAMVLEGENAISAVRLMNGVTNSAEALSGTIRGDFSLSKNHNCVHASDSPTAASREINLWFPKL